MQAKLQQQVHPTSVHVCHFWAGHPPGHEARVPQLLHGPHEVLCVTRQEQPAHHPVPAAVPRAATGCLQVSLSFMLDPV